MKKGMLGKRWVVFFRMGTALGLVALISCSKIERERIFDMPYPPIDFSFPGGIPPSSLWVQDYPALVSPFESFATRSGVDTAEVAGLFPFQARLISLDGNPLDFFRSVQVLICEPGTSECTLLGDEVFFNDQLDGREGTIINLQPGLRNVKKEFAGELVHLQLVFGLARTSPFTVDCRFEMSYEAVR